MSFPDILVYTSTDRLIVSEATSTVYWQRQHYGLPLPAVQLKSIICVYKTVIKYKVLPLEESECCKMASPDSYIQDNRDVKEQLSTDDGRLTKMKKIHFDFINPIWMQKRPFFLLYCIINSHEIQCNSQYLYIKSLKWFF